MFRFTISRAIGLLAAPTKPCNPFTPVFRNFSSKPQNRSRPLQVNNPLLKELDLENKALEELVAQKSLSSFKIEKRFESSLLGRSSPSCITLSREDERVRVTINLNETGYPDEQEHDHEHEHDNEHEHEHEHEEEAQAQQSENQEENEQNEGDEDYQDEANSPVTQFNARIEILDEKGQVAEHIQILGDLDVEQNDYAIHTIITNQNGTGLDVEALPEKLRDQIHKYFEQFGVNSELLNIYEKLYSLGDEEDAGEHDITNLSALQDLSKFVTNLNAAKRK